MKITKAMKKEMDNMNEMGKKKYLEYMKTVKMGIDYIFFNNLNEKTKTK